MNYARFKKRIVSLTLMCVFAFSTLVASAVPANAQWYQRQYVYSYPYVYYPYSYQPYSYYPYGYYPRGYYPYGYFPHRRHYWRDRDIDLDDVFDWLF
jgi:hypothetical protein